MSGGVRTVAAALVGALLTLPCPGEAQQARPNVIIVITDDQGYGDLGAHGNPVLKTPNLDNFHAESVRLTDFHVDPTCSPTRAALMTGRYSTRGGVWHTIAGWSLLRPQETTMAEVFAENGYRTGIFGKWHLGDSHPYRPSDRGFQEVLIHGGGGIGQTPDYWGNDYQDDHYWHNGEWRPFEGYCTDVFVDAAIEFIERSREQPFFVYIPTNVAHRPFNAPEGFPDPYVAQGVDPDLAHFYGMLTHLDGAFGRLRERLRELGLEENTIVIFTTDNGSAGSGYNAGLRERKGSEYDGGHRVPFILRYPAGGLAGGREVERLTAHVDLLPTLAELAGIAVPSKLELDGRSLVPLLRGEAWPERTLFVHSQRIQFPEKWRKSAVMTDPWRLVNGTELYDVDADPGQTTDVAGRYPNVVEQLRGEYDGWWESLQPHLVYPPRLVLGGDENPVRLTGHDWHAENEEVPWHQDHVADPEFSGSGFWTVEIARPGVYEFVLRPRPHPFDHAIQGTAASLVIGHYAQTAELPPGAREARFQARLPAGPADLRTAFIEADGSSRGAPYVYVRRVE